MYSICLCFYQDCLCWFIGQICETLQVIMKATVLQLSSQQKQINLYPKIIAERLAQSSSRSQSYKMVLLTVRKPAKIAGKQKIKELFQNEKKPTSFYPYPYNSPKTQSNEPKPDHQAQKIFKSNLRNLISKSAPYVIGQVKGATNIKKRIQSDFRTSKDSKVISQEPNKKQDNKDKRQKLRSIGCQESKSSVQKRLGYKMRHKSTFYINNFMKSKYTKIRKVSLDSNFEKSAIKQENLQKSGFFPWDRQLDSQEDILAAL